MTFIHAKFMIHDTAEISFYPVRLLIDSNANNTRLHCLNWSLTREKQSPSWAKLLLSSGKIHPNLSCVVGAEWGGPLGMSWSWGWGSRILSWRLAKIHLRINHGLSPVLRGPEWWVSLAVQPRDAYSPYPFFLPLVAAQRTIWASVLSHSCGVGYRVSFLISIHLHLLWIFELKKLCGLGTILSSNDEDHAIKLDEY